MDASYEEWQRGEPVCPDEGHDLIGRDEECDRVNRPEEPKDTEAREVIRLRAGHVN